MAMKYKTGDKVIVTMYHMYTGLPKEFAAIIEDVGDTIYGVRLNGGDYRAIHSEKDIRLDRGKSMVNIKLTDKGIDRVLDFFNEYWTGVSHNYMIIEEAEKDLTMDWQRKKPLTLTIQAGESVTRQTKSLDVEEEDYTREVVL